MPSNAELDADPVAAGETPLPSAGAADAGRAAARAVAWLAQGRLVAFPTETVWGLAANAASAAAVEALRAWKGRGEAHPMAVLVSSAAALERRGVAVSDVARRLADHFWPGPLTLVVPAADVPALASGIGREDGALGVRCSSHPAAFALAVESERRGLGPPTATSFNRTGQAPARTRSEALALCARPPEGGAEAAPEPIQIEIIDVGAGEAEGAAPSTVVDVTREAPRILRRGAVAADHIESVLACPVEVEPESE